ncbi:hypothetical protein W97_02545 [Coniosporium apollinis CBS 100218]|uniref:Uncharacterized protein n=1 Tax=Coniosporium apollinis (strain CBS 100218) TaxID=1168221 RepID=R7YN74_CONA1|nr:uncharacterized protein W97_02545 [Coniosporium apollinis CBS 100218]EON63318.1 hypothetical protein W97_02545 [Coniosporium apollinis CBS 100218]
MARAETVPPSGHGSKSLPIPVGTRLEASLIFAQQHGSSNNNSNSPHSRPRPRKSKSESSSSSDKCRRIKCRSAETTTPIIRTLGEEDFNTVIRNFTLHGAKILRNDSPLMNVLDEWVTKYLQQRSEELETFLRDVDPGLADQLALRRAELQTDISSAYSMPNSGIAIGSSLIHGPRTYDGPLPDSGELVSLISYLHKGPLLAGFYYTRDRYDEANSGKQAYDTLQGTREDLAYKLMDLEIEKNGVEDGYFDQMVLNRHAFKDVNPIAPVELIVRISSQVQRPSALGMVIHDYAS